ncbi:GNAT superfamily N-acetyltransferase [Arthrobacter pascens]|uniref:GNAT family N-acetyltransferase n=1 Tax=Arthrobacter pascens TaxID=1677 RepID=UPI002790F77B|nr:GNAT family N-acetyltransferase [Arthrobacter pascens]MDQ0678087.1 GNAT superfamily N-acetyltransferase [Arthrobacter pascens]
MKDQPAGHLATAAAEWSDVEQLFGVRGDPSRCWCRYFALTGPQYSALDPTARKAKLKERFDGGSPSPGVIAFRDGEPVGWCAVEPRSCYPRVLRSQVLRRAEPDSHTKNAGTETAEGAEAGSPGDLWSVTCFVVAAGHRRSGVADTLLQAAVEHARLNGATVLEGYPVDPSQRPKAGSADLYHGTVNLFLRAGFRVVSAAVPGRAVMRLRLDGASGST